MGRIIGWNLWIILVLGPRQEHNTGAHEAAEIVDMAIDDTVISHDPSPEPDDLLQPQVLFQHLLHPFSAQVRVSWCMEQAFLRAHQCPAERVKLIVPKLVAESTTILKVHPNNRQLPILVDYLKKMTTMMTKMITFILVRIRDSYIKFSTRGSLAMTIGMTKPHMDDYTQIHRKVGNFFQFNEF